MKKLLISLTLLLVTTSFAAEFAPTGGVFINKKTKEKIYLGCYGYVDGACHKATFILQNKSGIEKIINDSLVMIFDNTTDEFHNRWYVYNVLKTNASTGLNPIPYTSYIINMQRSSKLYLDGFKLMDKNNGLKSEVNLKNSYFKSLLKSITEL